MSAATGDPSTFKSIFFHDSGAVRVRIPDYQRAYSWEQKQIELFLADIVKYQSVGNGYYFGHFIAEKVEDGWDIVDGQQRITTFVLFLMVCRVLSPSGPHASAFSMIRQFSTVSYDADALKNICDDRLLSKFLGSIQKFDPKNPPSDTQIVGGLELPEEKFTRSQRRMVLALLRLHQAFQNKGELDRDKIEGYIDVVMKSLCSHHLTRCKSMAANMFEMQNTRGVPLSTLEIVKAKLMKFVYDHGGEDQEKMVEGIQAEFSDIYRMEERLAARSFRGEITMEQLLRLHLRVVDDGMKSNAREFDSPALNGNAEELIAYVDKKLEEALRKNPAGGIKYAIDLAREFKESVRIVSERLPKWDKEDPLVGDVLILDRDLSCQLFLIVCRQLAQSGNQPDARMASGSLLLWEGLLFTRDFHGEYHGLWHRDNFPALFQSCGAGEENISGAIKGYLLDGFRPPKTKNLQATVRKFLEDNKNNILNGAFYWWARKMTYAIYKYEVSRGANLRAAMKGVSVEHILPQEWQWDWVEANDVPPKKLSESERKSVQDEISSYINGIGNLLLLTPGENTSQGNSHPADKRYKGYTGGTYEEHDNNSEKWRSSTNWKELIQVRGEEIFKFMLGTLVGASDDSPSTRSSVGNPGTEEHPPTSAANTE